MGAKNLPKSLLYLHKPTDYLNAILNERVLSHRMHSELLIIFFQKARGCAPRVFKVRNQQFLVFSTIRNKKHTC